MKKGVDYIGVGVGAVIFNGEGRVFMAKRGPKAKNEIGKWEFPGGGVEFGEKLKETIVREMKEEFGITIEPLSLLGVNDHIIPDEKQHWVSPSFICRIVSGSPAILEPGKLDKIGWFDVKNVGQMDLSLVTISNLNWLKEKYPEKFK